MVRNHLSVDHIVELDMIVTFFTRGVGQTQGATLTQNQWTLLANFITSRGIQAVTGQQVRQFTFTTCGASSWNVV